MANIIKVEDFIQSIDDALQYISFYHPKDFIDAMYKAYKKEKSQAAKDAIAQILTNSRMAAEGHRPICQDTGLVCCFVDIGMDVRFSDTSRSVQELVDEGVRRAYLNKDNPLRASMVYPPHGSRKNTKDNTPANVHVKLVKGDKIDIRISAKGGGSEFKSKFKILNPSDSIIDYVTEMVPTMGAGWCPPGILGIGIGGSAEKAMLLAKDSLNEEINMDEILEKGPQNEIEQLRLDIYNSVNNLGIGAQGVGGLTTVLDVKVSYFGAHAATKPVAIIPSCAATRHIHFTLDGKSQVDLKIPKLEDWPKITENNNTLSKKINVNNITKKEIQDLKAGDTILLSGTILTGRDAAHKRIQDILNKGEKLPVDLENKFIYYVGPVDAVRDEIVGPAGPTTATRMDKFTDMMLKDVKISGMIGKSERGDETIKSIKENKSIYFMAVGGAAYLVSKAIKKSKVVAFAELGMEAIYEFEVEDMPVTVAVDSNGNSVHKKGPKEWKIKIDKLKKLNK